MADYIEDPYIFTSDATIKKRKIVFSSAGLAAGAAYGASILSHKHGVAATSIGTAFSLFWTDLMLNIGLLSEYYTRREERRAHKTQLKALKQNIKNGVEHNIFRIEDSNGNTLQPPKSPPWATIKTYLHDSFVPNFKW